MLRRARAHRRARTAALAIGVVALATLVADPAAAQPQPSRYGPPVDAPVLDPFRAPPTPYAAGNRGIDYATDPGTPVRAIGDGQVVFAGQVGGQLHVTVAHADGLRSSYSFLAEVQVGLGDAVARGTVVGAAGPMLHLGVRDADDRYLDPALLFDRPARAVLVPGGDDGAPRPDGWRERAALLGVVVDGWTRWGEVLVPGLPDLAGQGAAALAHELVESSPLVHLARITGHVIDHTVRAGPCTPPGMPVPPPSGRRIAVLVGGFGSTSEHAGIDGVDTAALGYDPGDVVRFSYRGGRTPPGPDAHGGLARLGASTYDADDSQGDLPTAADHLADLLSAVAAAEPGVPIDVLAHSQGGVVTRLALDRADATGALPPAVDAVVTLATPHQGADLATAAVASTAGPTGRAPLELLHRLGVPADPSRPALGQLAEVSPVIATIADAPPPAGVRLTSVAGRGDLVVPALRAGVTGGDHVVLPVSGLDAHDRLPSTPEATREVALAVAGLPPTCEDLADVVADAVVADTIGWLEDRAGLALGGVALAAPDPGGGRVAFGLGPPGS